MPYEKVTVDTVATTVEEVLEIWGGKRVLDVLKYAPAYLGNLHDSARFEIQVNGDVLTFEFMIDAKSPKGFYYWQVVDEGRKPGKPPPIDAILPWVKHKDIQSIIGKSKSGKIYRNKKGIPSKEAQQRSLAFLIARKIGRKGTKPTNFTSKVFSDAAFDELKKELLAVNKGLVIGEIKLLKGEIKNI